MNITGAPELTIKWRQDIWFGIFIGIAISGTCGNIFIVWMIKAHKTMQSKLNKFILNMAVSDLIVSLCPIIFEGYQLVYNEWIFSSALCTVVESVDTIGLCVFILSLTMVAMERHYAILPTAKRDDMDLNTMSSLEIWISSVILSAPNWIFATVYTPPGSTDQPLCVQVWPDANTGNSLRDIYSVFFIFLTYILPLLYMVYRFCRLGVNIWCTKNWPTSPENKKSVVIMIVVVLAYAMTSLPYRFCVLDEALCHEYSLEYLDIKMVAFMIAFSNVLSSPAIFCCLDYRYRLGLRKAFRWFPLVHYNPNNVLEGATDPVIMRCQILSEIRSN